MSRFKQYEDTRHLCFEQLKLGGDPMKAIALAIIAHAEAVMATETDRIEVELSGRIGVDND